MLALSLPAAIREATHGFAHPKREHGSRTPQPRTVPPTADRSQSGNNDLSATESEEILDQAIAMLQRRGRVTYGALKRQFNLDDAFLTLIQWPSGKTGPSASG